jgi:tRNA threonylcarbamoyladenosine biosynthesis protein TsaE
MDEEKYITYSEEETIESGAKFAKKLHPGDIVAFYGDLGAGKTEFIKGICDFFDVQEIVTSPTFTIMNRYTGNYKNQDIPIYHIDLYRIKNDKELNEIGFQECIFSDNGIKLIEWAEKANGQIPKFGYSIKIEQKADNEDERMFTINYTPLPIKS